MSANASTPVAQTMTTSTGATRQSAADQARLAAKVATFSSQDRWFERVTFLFAALVLLASGSAAFAAAPDAVAQAVCACCDAIAACAEACTCC